MDIDEWSQDSQAFKTITSGSQTRNQTSNKKQYEKHVPQKRNPPFYNRRASLSHLHKKLQLQLKRRKKQVVGERYSQLIITNKNIESIKQKIDKFHQQAALVANEKEQFAIYQQHEVEMKYFQQMWEEIFEKFRRKQEVKLLKMSVQQQKQSRELSIKLRGQHEKIERKYSKNKELMQLSRLQNDLIKKQKFTELAKLNIKRKKLEITKNLRQSQRQEMRKIEDRQMQKLRGKYDKKQEALKQKLKECREFQLRIYLKHQQRLKQKFMNSMNKLHHQQTMKKSRCQSAKK